MAIVYGQQWPRFASYSVTPAVSATGTANASSNPLNLWADLKKKWKDQTSPASASTSPVASSVPSAASGYDMAALQSMAKSVNDFNIGEMQGQLESGLPNYSGLLAQSSKNIAGQLGGTISQSTKDLMAQAAAERGVARGGQLVDADYLRALGLTAEGQQQVGEQNLSAAIARTPRADLFNIASMMITPQQQREYELAQAAQRTNEYNAETNRIHALNQRSGGGGGSTTMPIIQKYSQPGSASVTNTPGTSTQAAYPAIPISTGDPESPLTASGYAGQGWDEYFNQGGYGSSGVVPDYGLNSGFDVSSGAARSGWDGTSRSGWDTGESDEDYLNWYYGGY